MDTNTILLSAPAALFLVIGIILAKKYLVTPRPCPSKDFLDQNQVTLTGHTEAIKSLCVSIDKNTEAIKEGAKAHTESVLRLAETFINQKEK